MTCITAVTAGDSSQPPYLPDLVFVFTYVDVQVMTEGNITPP